MKKISIRPVDNNCTREEQLEKIKEEYGEFLYEANMRKSKNREKEEAMDLIQSIVTYYIDHLGDLKEDWNKYHIPKMKSRLWSAREKQ